jgi:uroporphyrinogen-III decarboxylase
MMGLNTAFLKWRKNNMANETMTGWERVWAAAIGEKPDRVPVVPVFGPYAATYQGMSQGEYYRDMGKGTEAMLKTFDDVGGWDAIWGSGTGFDKRYWNLAALYPMVVKEPGIDTPDDYVIQLHEKEVLTYDDYDRIAETGYRRFYFQDIIFRISDYTPETLRGEKKTIVTYILKARELWKKRNVDLYYTYGDSLPFFTLSLGRSLIRFTEDLYYRPEKIHAALRRMTDDIIDEGLKTTQHSDRKINFLVCERGSAYHYPLDIFENFWMKYVKEIIEAWFSEGIVTNFHLDTDWTKNLPSFKKNLPKHSFILELDSTTDLINAREIMGDHCCIKGDVPATLLSLGTPEDVDAYCRKMIRTVGRNGGYILASGCEVPIDTKKENFLAMLNAAKTSFY